MPKQLNFHLKVINNGIATHAVYIAETSVDAPFSLHVDMDGTQKPAPANFSVEHKSSGTNYVTAYRTSLDYIRNRGYSLDLDFSHEAYPKSIRVISPLPVFSASITEESSASDLADIKAQLKELAGSADSTAASTPAIDSNKEVKDFLEGYDNTQKLKDVIKDSQVSVDEDGEALILG